MRRFYFAILVVAIVSKANESQQRFLQFTPSFLTPSIPTVTVPEAPIVDSQNWTSILGVITQQYDTIFFSDLRLEGHVITDKPVYQNLDVVFIEVYVVDAFSKVPATLSEFDRLFYSLSFYLEVRDPDDNTVYQSLNSIDNSTVSFTYKIPDNAPGGNYNIFIYNRNLPDTFKQFKVQVTSRPVLNIVVSYDKETYNPNELVTGQINITRTDGFPFTEPATFTFQTFFGITTVNSDNISTDLEGFAQYQIQIPSSVPQLVNTVSYTIKYQDIQQLYSTTLTIGDPTKIVIDFVPETNLYVYNVPNKLYFQAFINSGRGSSQEFVNASLLSSPLPITAAFLSGVRNFLIPQNQNNQVTTIIDKGISTAQKGAGVFEFTPKPYTEYYLEIDLGGESPQKVDIPVVNLINSTNPNDPSITFTENGNVNEVSFTIKNANKVLENNEDLIIQLMTNELVVSGTQYVLAVLVKEKILFSQAMVFNQSQDYQYTIPAASFPFINGGVMQVNLYQLDDGDITLLADSGFNSLSNDSSVPLSLLPNMYDKGETLFFKKPSSILKLNVTTDKEFYYPGDEVIVNATILSDIDENADYYVSLYATDNTVFNKVPLAQQPAPLPTLVYLEYEIKRNNDLFLWSNQFLNHMYLESDDINAAESKNLNLELLLGKQSWRYQVFFFPNVVDVPKVIQATELPNQTQLSQVFAFPFISSKSSFIDLGQPSVQPLSASAGISVSGGGGLGTSASILAPPQSVRIPSIGSGTGEWGVTGIIGVEPAPTAQEFVFGPELGDFMANILKNTRFYKHELRAGFEAGNSIDFTETLLYASALKFEKGQRSMVTSFVLSDLITQFKVTANAFNSNGALGFKIGNFQTREDITLTFEIPTKLVEGDQIDIQLVLFNNLQVSVTGYYEFIANKLYSDGSFSTKLVDLEPSSSGVVNFRIYAYQPINNLQVIMKYYAIDQNNTEYETSQTRFIDILSSGYLQSVGQGGLIGIKDQDESVGESALLTLNVSESIMPGSLTFTASILSSNYALMQQAIKTLNTKPANNFQSVVAATQPLIYQLNYLKSLPNITDQVQSQITQVTNQIQDAYDNILNYENSEGTYEWFGGSPGTDVLSAYAAENFNLMNQQSSIVDQNKIRSLGSYLYDSQDLVNGGFNTDPNALDSDARPPKIVTDAYIIWSITNTKEQSPSFDIDFQVQYLYNYTLNQINNNQIETYVIALTAGALYNNQRADDGRSMADLLIQHQNSFGQITDSFTTITMSKGKDLEIETTALAVLLWINEYDRYKNQIQLAVDYIISQVNAGTYGGSQSTLLAVRALDEFMKIETGINGEGNFDLYIDQQLVQSKGFSPQEFDSITFDLSDYTKQHKSDKFFAGNSVQIELKINNYTQTTFENLFDGQSVNAFKLIYYMNAEFYDTNPPKSQEQESDLQYGISVLGIEKIGKESEAGSIVTYRVNIGNKNQDQGLLIIVAIIYVPSCLTIDFKYLDQLESNNLIDSYSVRNSNSEIVLQWRELKAGENKQVDVNLIQSFAGVCFQYDCSAYVFYNEDATVSTQPTAELQ